MRTVDKEAMQPSMFQLYRCLSQGFGKLRGSGRNRKDACLTHIAGVLSKLGYQRQHIVGIYSRQRSSGGGVGLYLADLANVPVDEDGCIVAQHYIVPEREDELPCCKGPVRMPKWNFVPSVNSYAGRICGVGIEDRDIWDLVAYR